MIRDLNGILILTTNILCLKIMTRLSIYSILLIITGCVLPEIQLQQQAKSHGFTHHPLTINGFLLTVFKNRQICNNNKLHVYLAGDGLPWKHHRQVAIDPTPNHLLVLDLMSEEKTSSVYLGRPCYHGQYHSESCHPLYWTHWRYSATVAETMLGGLQQLLKPFANCEVTLIGYSGGGTLAMLIAPKLAQVSRVVTISGNLDVGAWTRYHHYSPLAGSLDPAMQPALLADVTQFHLIGNDDKNTPAEIVLPAIKLQPNPVILRYPDVDHDCCWAERWPAMLDRLKAE